MENNFYIGIVHHKKRVFKSQYEEKIVLYSINDINYIDLINNIVYTTDSDSKDYVVRDSLIPTDVSEHRIDYMYLLSRYNSEGTIGRKKTRTIDRTLF